MSRGDRRAVISRRGSPQGVLVERDGFVVSLAPPFEISQRDQVVGYFARMIDGVRQIEGPAKFPLGRSGIAQSQLEISQIGQAFNQLLLQSRRFVNLERLKILFECVVILSQLKQRAALALARIGFLYF